MQLHDVLMTQAAHDLRLRVKAVVVLPSQRHLQHVLPSVAFDEKGERRRTLSEALSHDEAMLELVACAGIERIGAGTLLGPGELVFDVLELLQELAGRSEPDRHLGMRRILHEQLQALPGTIEDGRDLQALFLQQPLGHLDEARRRRATREEVVRDGAEREDVELFARGPALGNRLGSHVDPGALFDERVEPAGPRRGRSGRPGVESMPRSGLPVEHLDPWLRGFRIDHQNALRRQRAVNQMLRMGEVHGFRDLAEQVEARIDIEAGGPLGEPVVEALTAFTVLENQRRTVDVVGVGLGLEDALVPYVEQDLIFPSRRALQRLPLLIRGGRGNRVDPDPRVFSVDGGVTGRPVLVVRPFEEELVEPVVAHAPGGLRRANASLLHGAADRLGHRPVRPRPGRCASAVPCQRCDDPGSLVSSRSGIAAMHPVSQVRREAAVDVLVRQEHVGFQERARHLLPQRRLSTQEGDQLLRLAIREQQWVVDRLQAPIVPPRPRALVALHDSGAALDLDEVEALRRQHEQVDLVDRTVVGDELEVRPRAVRVVIGQPVAHERERVPLPGELRVRDRLPTGRDWIHGVRGRCHVQSRASGERILGDVCRWQPRLSGRRGSRWRWVRSSPPHPRTRLTSARVHPTGDIVKMLWIGSSGVNQAAPFRSAVSVSSRGCGRPSMNLTPARIRGSKCAPFS